MRIQNIFAATVLTAAIGGLIVPAFAQMQGPAGSPPNGGMDQMESGARMGHDKMSGGGMSGGMMGGGCASMMQSMNGGGRPNNQWQKHAPDGATLD